MLYGYPSPSPTTSSLHFAPSIYPSPFLIPVLRLTCTCFFFSSHHLPVIPSPWFARCFPELSENKTLKSIARNEREREIKREGERVVKGTGGYEEGTIVTELMQRESSWGTIAVAADAAVGAGASREAAELVSTYLDAIQAATFYAI